MPADDFIRVIYMREKDGKKKRTSVSIDPDLFDLFSLVKGGSMAARLQIRDWALIECHKIGATTSSIGVSRLVVRRIMADIKKVVEQGLKVEWVQPDSEQPIQDAPSPEPTSPVLEESSWVRVREEF